MFEEREQHIYVNRMALIAGALRYFQGQTIELRIERSSGPQLTAFSLLMSVENTVLEFILQNAVFVHDTHTLTVNYV